MITVTAHDIRALAQSRDEDPVLAVVDGDVRVLPAAEGGDTVLYRGEELRREYGDEITDIEAETLAAGLTAQQPA